MKLKKLFYALLCACLIFSMCASFVACDDEEEPTEKPTEETQATEESQKSTTKATKATKATQPDNPDLTAYSIKEINKFVYPIWETDISYAESTFVRENEDGVVEPLQLLYPIDDIIAVRSADLKTLYVEGKDYKVTSDGNIEILRTGSIPVLAYEDYIFSALPSGQQTVAGGNPIWAAGKPNTQLVYGEISTAKGGMSQWVLAVTYKHSAESVVSIPEDKSEYFQPLIKKLEAGEKVTIVSMGDSITEGWSSSAVKGQRDPKCPPYNQLVANYITKKYHKSVDFYNEGLSGTTSATGNQSSGSPNGQNPNLLKKVCDHNPDLVMIAYGMNDGCGIDAATYASNITKIIEYIDENCPDACIVVVGTSLPNEEMSWSNGGNSILVHHKNYRISLTDAEEAWHNKGYQAAYADVTTTNIEMFERKAYQDVTGSNSNHPNDYMHRVYAQVILQTIFGEV